MQFTDSAVVAGTRRREDGALIADARVARTGIQVYRGSEVGKPEMDIVRVYRPGAEVFSEDTLKSAAHRPVTNDHPPEMVTSETWKQHAVGQTGDEIAGEGIFIRVPLMVSDEAAIKDVENGKRELSAGYTCTLDWTAGKTPAGDDYDAVQRNIRINHVAIVRQGRAGSQVRIGDDAKSWGASPVTTQTADERTIQMDLRTVLVDGLQVSTTEAGAQAITKLTNDLKSSAAKFSDLEKAHDAKIVALNADHTKALAAKDADLAKKDEEIGTLKADLKKAQDAALKPADIDKLVADRAALVAVVRTIDASIEVAGKSDADLRRAAVKAKLGDEMVKDASDAEVAGMFKAVAKDAKPVDAFRQTVQGGVKSHDGSATDAAHKGMTDWMTSAWQNQTKGAA